VARAIDAHRKYVRTETLATMLEGDSVAGASDAVEPESVSGPGGLIDAAGWYLDQIEVGEHQVRIAVRPAGTRAE
jgi:hypothetical protein